MYPVRLCSQCIQQLDFAAATRTIVPKRYRYYWEHRAINRDKQKMIMITLPRLSAKKEVRKVQKQEPKLYGMDVLYHKEVQEIFNNSRMIAACLHAKQIQDNYFEVRYELRQHGMSMEKYDHHIMEFTLKNTPYSNLLTLFDGDSAIIHGEPNVSQMLAALKKNKQLLLVGGMIDGKLMSVPELNSYAQLKGLDHSRSELCGILSMATASTYNLLNQPASNLSLSLGQYVNDNRISETDDTKSSSVNDSVPAT